MNHWHESMELLRLIFESFKKDANRELSKIDLTISQIPVLMHLYRAPEYQLPLKGLDKILHVSQPTTTGLVARLEKKGLLEYLPDPNDSRAKNIRLTSNGIICCRNGAVYRDNKMNAIAASLTQDEIDTLFHILSKIAAVMD